MKKITKTSLIKEIFLNFPDKAPEIAKFLSDSGVACVSCCASAWETLEEGLKNHGKSNEEIEKIVTALNNLIKK